MQGVLARALVKKWAGATLGAVFIAASALAPPGGRCARLDSNAHDLRKSFGGLQHLLQSLRKSKSAFLYHLAFHIDCGLKRKLNLAPRLLLYQSPRRCVLRPIDVKSRLALRSLACRLFRLKQGESEAGDGRVDKHIHRAFSFFTELLPQLLF
jgi:hypothetical protein